MSDIFGVKNFNHDVLIIGAGGSGIAAGIFAAKRGLNVAISSKVHPLKSHTVAAQGGINAALANNGPDDIKWHIYDTIKAADGLADEDSVEYMCTNAPGVISMLQEIGVEFDVNDEGKIDQKIYGGQRTNFGEGNFAHRACYVKDRTGHSIMHKLYEKALSLGIIFYNYHFALDLIHQDNKCFGAYFWDIDNGKTKTIFAANTIIATGGCTQIYATSTSANICTGDGNGIAARAGIPLQDMEFVQFHPTAINKIGVLITEAARSAGGKLINAKGERFMSKYSGDLMELATRDVVARAIANEINIGNGAGKNKDHVWLDLTHLTSDEIKNSLPTVYENAMSFANIDPSISFIPISPAAHYNMGGIPTNQNCQVITYDVNSDKESCSLFSEVIFNGLYAIGEAASISVHGAGRLGCNSLLDLLVFAKKVGSEIQNNNPVIPELIDQKFDIFNQTISCDSLKNEKTLNLLLVKLKQIMQKNAGVFRSQDALLNGQKELNKIENQFKKIRMHDRSTSWNLELQHYLEFKNMLISAKAIIASALWRKESRGSHWRNDYPMKNDDFRVHAICLIKDDEVIMSNRKVRMNK